MIRHMQMGIGENRSSVPRETNELLVSAIEHFWNLIN